MQRLYRCVGLFPRAAIVSLCRCVCAGVFINSDRIAVLACALAAIVSLVEIVDGSDTEPPSNPREPHEPDIAQLVFW